jgi:zinc transporter ZupT
MSSPSRRARLPLNDKCFWQLLAAVVALALVLAFIALICWLFLAFQQQQLLGQILAGFAAIVAAFMSGAGVRGLWPAQQQSADNER